MLAYKCGPFSVHKALKVLGSRLLRYGVDILVMHSISLLIECVFVADFYVVFGEVSGGFRAPGL
jgi:hypothetical protein